MKSHYDFQLILALLVVDETDNYEFFCYKYKISNKIRNRLKIISKNFKNFKNKKFYSEKNLKKLIYFNNKSAVNDILLFLKCLNNKKDLDINSLLNYVKILKIPKFPITGDDLKKHGYESGQKLGAKLKSMEEQWVENNFVLDKKIEKTLSTDN